MTYEEAKNLVLHGRYAEADEMILKALEKQIPRVHEIRVNRCHKEEIYCPNCDRYHGLYGAPSMDAYSKFCPWCGQALDMRYAE